MEDCIFCKIVKGEIPSEKIYEDDKVFAFLDIGPNSLGHTLVILKEHSEDLMHTSELSLAELIQRIPKIAQAVMSGLDYPAFILSTNNGKEAGQEVAHLHFHIIPRKSGDGLQHFPSIKYAEGEMHAVAEKIRTALN
jgi:histidine triad (HIT) family protein